MKILYLCADPGIPIRGHKGAAIHVRALIDAFSNLGHDVTLICARAGSSDGPQPNATLVEAEWDREGAVSGGAGEQRAQSAASAVLGAARSLLKRENFDLIYERYSLWSAAGAQLASETALPFVAEVNAPLRLEAARYRGLVDAQTAADIELQVVRSAAALVVVSEPLKRYLIDRGASSLKVHVIANAVDERIFHPGVDGRPARRRLGLDDRFIVGFVGTARPWHDLEALLGAMAELTSRDSEMPVLHPGRGGPYHLLLVGAFPEAVRTAIRERGLTDKVTMLGSVPQPEIPSLLAAMDVTVSPHPDLPDFYFSPLKLFEYLACGRATVAADVPPIAAVVHDGSEALLYRPGEPRDLAARIASLAAAPALREAIGMAAAREVLLHHTWTGNALRTIELIGGAAPASGALPANQSPIWDDKLGRALYRASRLDVANALFSAQFGSAAPFTGWRVLKYWPGKRCVIAYERIAPDSDARTIVGKVYRSGRAQAHFDLQKALWDDGFGGSAADHIMVAEPIAHVREMNMVLQAFAPGRPLDEPLEEPNLEHRVRMSAAAIAKLHDSRLRPRAVYSLEDELSNLERWGAALNRLRPELASSFDRYLDELRLQAQALPQAELVPVHRDFYYSQLLFSGETVTLIDLDLLAWGDPAIDVANFAAHLLFLAAQTRSDPHDFDAMKDIFVNEYLTRRPMSQAASRLAFYEAATLFRLLYVTLTRPAYTAHFDVLLHSVEQHMLATTESRA